VPKVGSDMIKIGVTGTIGSGKTTLCNVWEELGAKVVYADDLAREMMVSDSQMIRRIREAFGDDSYFADGTLNREYLAREAFRSGRVDELNKIVHPFVRRRTEELMEQAEKEGFKLFAEEAALLLLDGRPKMFDRIVLVRSNRKDQLARVRQRDGLRDEEILARMDRQPSEDTMASMADHIIMNDATLELFREKCTCLYHELTKTYR